MYLAKVKNASSTPSFTFALVSINRIPSSSANARPCSWDICRFSFQSDLLPIRILFTPSDACCSIFACQARISEHGIRSSVIYSVTRREMRLTIEGLLICDVVYQQDAHSTAVIGSCDSPEAFLSSSVPLISKATQLPDPAAVESDVQSEALFACHRVQLYGS